MFFSYKQVFDDAVGRDEAFRLAVDAAVDGRRWEGRIVVGEPNVRVGPPEPPRPAHLAHLGPTLAELGQFLVVVDGEERAMTPEERAADPDVSARDAADAALRDAGTVGLTVVPTPRSRP